MRESRCNTSGLLLLIMTGALVSCAEGSREPSAGAREPVADAREPVADARDQTVDVRDAAISASASATAPREVCVVASVSDGDSLRCTDQRRVRLLLLDAPEMSQAPFGAQSRDALRARLRRVDTLWLEYDVQRTDQYGRTLAHGWTEASGGLHVNLEQAREGWALAVVFPPNVRYVERVREAVAEARRERRGLWNNGRFTCTPIDHKRGRC